MSKSKTRAEQLFNVKLTLLEPMLGTVPKNKDIYAKFIASKSPENGADEVETVQEMEDKGWTGFHEDDEGIFLFDYQIKGFFKDTGNVMKDIIGIKALKSKLENFLYILPRKIRLQELMPEPLERPIRAMTRQGPIVSLIRSDQVPAGTEINFQIELLRHKEVNQKTLQDILARGRRKGLGQFRNGGYGRFKYELIPGTEE